MTELNSNITSVEKQQQSNTPDAVKHNGTIVMLPVAQSTFDQTKGSMLPDTEGSLALKHTVADLPSSTQSRSISSIMRAILTRKEAHFDQIEKQGRTKNDWLINIGNLVDTTYLLLEAIKAMTLASNPLANTLGLSVASVIFGVIGGVQSIGEGVISIKEGIQASKNNDGKINKLAARLLFTGCLEILVGSVMIFASVFSLAANLGFTSGIATFFAANPWLLAVLFLLMISPILVEVASRTGKIWQKEDVGFHLQLATINGILKDKEEKKTERVLTLLHKVFNLEEYEKLTEDKRIERLSSKMEELQTEIGVKAAKQSFDLIMQIVAAHEEQVDIADSASIIKTITDLRREIKIWNRILHVRLVEQLLYVIAFPVSLIALAPAIIGCNLFLAAANAMPGYLDYKFPDARTVLKVTPKVKLEEAKEELQNQNSVPVLV